MKKKILSVLLSITLIGTGCGVNNSNVNNDVTTNTNETKENDTTKSEEAKEEVEENKENSEKEETVIDDNSDEEPLNESNDEAEVIQTKSVSLLGDEEEIYYDPSIVPCIPKYKVEDDFSNVVYDKKFDYLFNLDEENEYNHVKDFRQALIDNMFVVRDYGNDEFFDVYEGNRYNYFPNFITVDSLMHTYHLYFSYLMKKTETNYLSDRLLTLTNQMLEQSVKQYEDLKGTDFENAAKRNLEFFYVGSLLLDDSIKSPVDDNNIIDEANAEYDKIFKADGIEECIISGLNEDYTQYKPRGYYEGDEKLEKYFRAMMWYGRIPFALNDADQTRSSMLITLAIAQNPDDWKKIYEITSFFAGTSDDPGYTQLSQIIEESYGKIPGTSDLTDDAAFNKVIEKVKKLNPPKINSVPVYEDEEAVIPSFRFMGQRFSVDAAIMQRLVYRYVEENEEGNKRLLPDTLDTAAALGSETALSILENQGDTKYKNYTDNMTILQKVYNVDDPQIWNVSLYSGWLNTLRPLFEKKTEGYPSYTKSEEWEKKNLETFAGSYAELKHDTILYSKQIMAEMGGPGDEEIPDDRGYVDPEPVIYSRFLFLSNKTKDGLDSYGMLDESDKKNLDLLSEIAKKLLEISEKELKNETVTDDDYEFIRTYGGSIEHFWIEVNKDNVDDLSYSYQAPCQIVADIATDPNGQVLEVGSGDANTMFVVFPIDGELHVGSGSVYSFYQFTVPISERMTDSEWKDSLEGGHYDDDFNWVENENKPEHPEWTMSYRIK